MSYSSTQTSTHTITDIENVIRRFTADLLMIASSSGAITEVKAREWVHDIEIFAKNGYLHCVDLTLISNGEEKKATRFYVNESGGENNDRPGNAMWPKINGAHLRVVLSFHDNYDQAAKQRLSGKMKISWIQSNDDISHSNLRQTSSREYSSNSYSLERKDYNE